MLFKSNKKNRKKRNAYEYLKPTFTKNNNKQNIIFIKGTKVHNFFFFVSVCAHWFWDTHLYFSYMFKWNDLSALYGHDCKPMIIFTLKHMKHKAGTP